MCLPISCFWRSLCSYLDFECVRGRLHLLQVRPVHEGLALQGAAVASARLKEQFLV